MGRVLDVHIGVIYEQQIHIVGIFHDIHTCRVFYEFHNAHAHSKN